SNCRKPRRAENRAARGLGRSTQRRLLPVLLDARGAQPGEAVTVDRILPGEEFLDRQGVTVAGLLERQESAAHGGDDLRFAPDDPAFGTGRRQIRDRQRTAVRPNNVLGPRTVGLSHMNTHITRPLLRPERTARRLKFG